MKYEKKSSGINLKFIIPIGIILCGYLFFFTSRWWMPVGSNVSYHTALGTTQNWNDREITLIRWDYCEKDRSMEIELDIQNHSFDGINTYVASAADINEGYIDIEKIVEEPDWVIIKLSNLPKRWSEISLRLGMSEEDNDPCKVYTNIVKVNQVDKLGKNSISEYRIQRFNIEIENYNQEISQKEQNIEKIKKTNENIQQEILRLEENKKYETEQQIASTDEVINSARTQLNLNNESITENEKDITEIEQRIGKIQKQIEELKNGG